jgi:hypothetical protein
MRLGALLLSIVPPHLGSFFDAWTFPNTLLKIFSGSAPEYPTMHKKFYMVTNDCSAQFIVPVIQAFLLNRFYCFSFCGLEMMGKFCSLRDVWKGHFSCGGGKSRVTISGVSTTSKTLRDIVSCTNCLTSNKLFEVPSSGLDFNSLYKSLFHFFHQVIPALEYLRIKVDEYLHRSYNIMKCIKSTASLHSLTSESLKKNKINK